MAERLRANWFQRHGKPCKLCLVYFARQAVAAPLYEALKRDKVLVRYMNYPGWGDGLRISVGTDDQADACIGFAEEVI